MMRHPPTRSGRGIALLLALMALSLLSLTGLGLLRTATNTSIAGDLATERAQANRLLDDLVRLIPDLMAAEDVREDDIEPRADIITRVLDEQIENLRLRVDRIDLSARLHLDHLRSFAADGLPSPLDALGPALAAKSQHGAAPQRTPTLDQLVELLPPHQQHQVSAFPTLAEGSQVILADWVTPHGNGTLNIETTPVPLLRAALHGLDPASANEAVAHRLRGEVIPADLARRLITERRRHVPASGTSKAVPLATDSSAVAFLVTIEQPTTTERWWIVCERAERESPSSARYSLRRGLPSSNGWAITRWRRIS